MNYRKNSSKFWGHLLSTPFIWAPLPFAILLDLVIEVYQQICFPIYGLEKVKRDDYILVLDRMNLKYLSPIEKINCMYCGYMNGLFAYLKEIANRTETYWCGIRHQDRKNLKGQEHQQKNDFLKYGDEEAFKKGV